MIDNPIRIGEEIYRLLTTEPMVAAIVGAHIYPYTTGREINGPHVVYDGISISYGETKDGGCPESVDATIHANTGDYRQGMSLASAIVDTMLERGVRVASVDCDYDSVANMFVHNISISITL